MSRAICRGCGHPKDVKIRDDLSDLFFFFNLDHGTFEPLVPTLCTGCYQRILSKGYREIISNRVFNRKYQLVVRTSEDGRTFSIRSYKRGGPLASWGFVSESVRSHDFFDTYTLFNAKGVELIVSVMNRFSTIVMEG